MDTVFYNQVQNIKQTSDHRPSLNQVGNLLFGIFFSIFLIMRQIKNPSITKYLLFAFARILAYLYKDTQYSQFTSGNCQTLTGYVTNMMRHHTYCKQGTLFIILNILVSCPNIYADPQLFSEYSNHVRQILESCVFAVDFVVKPRICILTYRITSRYLSRLEC